VNTTTTPDLDRRFAAVTLLDVRTVAGLLAMSVRNVWRQAALSEAGHGSFPKPLRLGPKIVRWRLGDMEAYLSGLAGERKP
jgi:predicted DNA-binding transcriptional regulator AlpA